MNLRIKSTRLVQHTAQIDMNPFLLVTIDSYMYLLSYPLTELSPSRGAANCAATQELPSILWNPKYQYRVHRSPSWVHILSHINPIHTIPSYFSKIYFDIVHRPTSWLPKCTWANFGL
jgi:hypothetical protein